jgi:hypothetical protein
MQSSTSTEQVQDDVMTDLRKKFCTFMDSQQRVFSYLESHEKRLGFLESEQKAQADELSALKTFVQEKLEVAERTQHDPYSAAFRRNEEFLEVFLFLVVFGYDTTSGLTSAVFRTVTGTPCVCVNFRALHVMGKFLLNARKHVLPEGVFPRFSNFRIGRLQELFRVANVPVKPLSQDIVNKLYNYTCVEKLNEGRASINNWIALETEPFVFTLKTLIQSGKVREFKQKFTEYYPKDGQGTLSPQGKVTEKDKVNLLFDADVDERVPVFGKPYWRELFYKDMLVYRKLFNPEDEAAEYRHFGSFYQLADPHEEPVVRFENLSFEEEEGESEDDVGGPRKKRRTM